MSMSQQHFVHLERIFKRDFLLTSRSFYFLFVSGSVFFVGCILLGSTARNFLVESPARNSTARKLQVRETTIATNPLQPLFFEIYRVCKTHCAQLPASSPLHCVCVVHYRSVIVAINCQIANGRHRGASSARLKRVAFTPRNGILV